MLIIQSRVSFLCRPGMRHAMIKHLHDFSQVFNKINGFMLVITPVFEYSSNFSGCFINPWLNWMFILET